MQYDPEEPGSHNNVANVPEKSTTRVFAPLKKMKKLTKLSLFENEIQFIDSFAELAELKKLIYLDLSLNMIDKFEGFGQSKKLEYLNLGKFISMQDQIICRLARNSMSSASSPYSIYRAIVSDPLRIFLKIKICRACALQTTAFRKLKISSLTRSLDNWICLAIASRRLRGSRS